MDPPPFPLDRPPPGGAGYNHDSESSEIPAVPNPFGILHDLAHFTQANTTAIGQLGDMLREYAHISEHRQDVTRNAPSAPGPKVREPRTYDGDRSNGQLDDHIRDVTNWINFYDRRGHWTSEREKVEMASTYLTGRMHRMYTLTNGSIQTVPAYLDWLRDTFRDNNEQSRLRDQWHACLQGDRPVMEYAQDLIYLAARIQPQKAASEIKEHFRTGLADSIQIGIAEHPEWDDLELFEYIKCADRQQQVEDAKAQVRKRTGSRVDGRILTLAGAPRRGNGTSRKPMDSSSRPRKGTKEWQEWCKRSNACFGCGSTDHGVRKCPEQSVPPRRGMYSKPKAFEGRRSRFVRNPRSGPREFGASERRTKATTPAKLRAIAPLYDPKGSEWVELGPTPTTTRASTQSDDSKATADFDQLRRKEQIFTLKTQLSGTAACQLRGYAISSQRMLPIHILIDSGATEQYLSTEMARNLQVEIEKDRKPYWVQVANGTYVESVGKASLTIQINQYRVELVARVLELPGYDFILGFEWLRTANPQIDWQQLRIQVRDEEGQPHELFPTELSPGQSIRTDTWATELLSLRSTLKAIGKSTTQLFLGCLKDTSSRGDLPIEEGISFHLDTPPNKPLRAILYKYREIFREELPATLPPDRADQHSIDTGDAEPINLNAYPLSPIHIAEQGRQIEQMLRQGIIQESSSPWGFPVLFVRKPEGKWRMCIDYRALNAVTVKNGYPLPRIQECLDLIGKARYLSKLDLTQGYYQVRVHPDSRTKTAFNTREGKFEYCAMPFGLCNAPATFQALMNRILREFIAKFVIVYLDDILIYSNTLDEHLRHLARVFEVLHQNTLYIKPSKCHFLAQTLEFCGHLIGNGQIRPLPAKIEIIVQWPTPTNVHELRQFLGLASYYRRYIRGFARICVPLFTLLQEADAEIRKQKFRRITWNTAAEDAFQTLKHILTSAPVLLQPDTTRSFIIETDASEWAIGCVLLQTSCDSNQAHPVAYDGRKLTPAEVNYPVHEKELLAIKYALNTWRIYIENEYPVTIYTDHESLKYLQTMRNPTKRLARWIADFSEYRLDIRYRKGASMVAPDAISRRPDLMGDGPRNLAAHCEAIRGLEEDEWAEYMVRLLRDGEQPPIRIRSKVYENRFLFTVKDDTLYRVEDQVESPYVPVPFRTDFLERMHTEYGHLGYPGILGVINGRGWWLSLQEDIRAFTRSCPQCQVAQRSRPGQEREQPQTLNQENLQIFDRWALDLIGILPKTPAGNRWIITAIEYLTGWPIAIAVPDARAETVARFIHEQITMVYGAPREILSDNGANLTQEVVTHYISLLKTKHRVTTPYHPRTNGKVENFNGFLGATLTRLLTNQPIVLWDQYLPQALFATRIRIHVTTRKSPYFLLFGCNPRLPTDENEPRPFTIESNWEDTLRRIETLQHTRIQANRRLIDRAVASNRIRQHLVRESPLTEGQWVLVRAEARNKFEGRWFGPYRIVKKMPLGTYQLADPKGKQVKALVNGQRLIPARLRSDTVENLWNSSKIQGRLRKQEISVEPPTQEFADFLATESESTPSYEELARNSNPVDFAERPGVRSSQVGEEVTEDSNKENITPEIEPLRTDTVDIEWDDEPRQGQRTPREREIQETQEESLPHPLPTPDSLPPMPVTLHSESPIADTTDCMEGVEASVRPTLWQREQNASVAEHERDTTRYGLRARPQKKRM